MFVALAVLLIILSIAAHEFGHACAMKSIDVRFDEAGLGIPIPRVPCLRLSFKRNGKPPLILCLHPLMLGAYVKVPADEQAKLDALPYKDKAFIFGAGILANLIFAGVLLTGANFAYFGFTIVAMLTDTRFIVTAGITLFLILFPKFFCRYLVPVLGLAMLGLVIWAVLNDPLKSLAGPIGIGKMVANFSVSIMMAVNMGAIVSLALATCNALPFYPLDGGLIAGCILQKSGAGPRVMRVFRIAGITAFVLLVAAAFSIDFINIFK
jgi:membrane-associated protease RseP (regulator of RpoE activity)